MARFIFSLASMLNAEEEGLASSSPSDRAIDRMVKNCDWQFLHILHIARWSHTRKRLPNGKL